MVRFVPAVAYHFCLDLPVIFSQPHTRTFSQLFRKKYNIKVALHLLYLKVARVFLQAKASGATQRGPTPLLLHPLGHERAEADEHEANEDRGQDHGDHDRYVSPVRACKSIGSLKNLFRMQVRWFWSERMVMIISPLTLHFILRHQAQNSSSISATPFK